MERALAPRTAALICVCEDEREVAVAHGVKPARLEVVHNGCPPCDAPPAGGLVVGAVTVLRRQKRLDVLLEAAPRILDAVPGATVKIAGDGPEGPALRAAADPRVVFEPFRGHASDHLRELAVYVLPSSWEAFPIGVLEAMACGVPQVATDVGGTREAVTPESGILIAPRDATALADAVIELLDDPQRRERMSAVVTRAARAALHGRADGRRDGGRLRRGLASVGAAAGDDGRQRGRGGSRCRAPATSRPRTGSRT